MSNFSGASEFYRKYRPGIPQEVAAILSDAVPSSSPRRLLDVGTGTGLVVEALLDHFDDIIAIDTDSEMLAAGEAEIRPMVKSGQVVVFETSAAEDYVPPAGWQPDLVTICRAFHWLDQEGELRLLHDQVADGGAVAVFGDNSFWVAESDWKRSIRAVITDFLGEERRAGTGVFKHHDRPYSEIMAESAFSDVSEFTVPVRREWTADGVLGYLYSTSFASPALFGDRLPEFDSTVRSTLASFGTDDVFIEENEFLIRLGRRPA